MRIDDVLTSDLSPKEAQFYKRVYDVAKLIDIKRDRPYGLQMGFDPTRGVFVQVLCDRPDTYTGEFGTGYGGKRYLSPTMTRSEITRVIFGAFIAYEEHETREAFTYRGVRVFGPHYDVDWLADQGEHIEKRGE